VIKNRSGGCLELKIEVIEWNEGNIVVNFVMV